MGMTIAEKYDGLGLSLHEEARVVAALTYASPVYRSYFGTSNGVGTLAKELAYANAVTGLGLSVATGTTPFSAIPVPPAP